MIYSGYYEVLNGYINKYGIEDADDIPLFIPANDPLFNEDEFSAFDFWSTEDRIHFAALMNLDSNGIPNLIIVVKEGFGWGAYIYGYYKGAIRMLHESTVVSAGSGGFTMEITTNEEGEYYIIERFQSGVMSQHALFYTIENGKLVLSLKLHSDGFDKEDTFFINEVQVTEDEYLNAPVDVLGVMYEVRGNAPPISNDNNVRWSDMLFNPTSVYLTLDELTSFSAD